jgi:hypothetical protein
MVFYTSTSDIPPSAKEPPPVIADETIPDEVPFGQPGDHIKVGESFSPAMKRCTD